MSLSLDGATGNITGLEVLRPQIPSGAIIQTVQGETNVTVLITTRTFTDTNLSASITTTSASSKVLVLVDQQFQLYDSDAAFQGGGIRILRGSTEIFRPLSDTNSSYDFWVNPGGATSVNFYSRGHIAYLDTPGAAGTYTYKTQARPYYLDSETPANAAFRAQVDPGVSGTNASSRITLLEVA
jgi:hypothetical protein